MLVKLEDIKKGLHAWEVVVHPHRKGATAMVSKVVFASAPYTNKHGSSIADIWYSCHGMTDQPCQMHLNDRNIPENSYNISRVFLKEDAAREYADKVNVTPGMLNARDQAKMDSMVEAFNDYDPYCDQIDDHVHYLDAIRHEDEDERDRRDMEAYYEEERRQRDERDREIQRRGDRYAVTNLGNAFRDAMTKAVQQKGVRV